MKNKDKEEVMTGMAVIDKFTKKVTPFGTSGHVNVGKDYVGDEAEITIRRRWMICRRCSETFVKGKNFSEDLRYCQRCYEALKYIEKKKGKLKCKSCGKKITEQEYKEAWDNEICDGCLIKELEKDESKEKLNKGVDVEYMT